MLLIDGAKFDEWTPEKEIEEFHPLIEEHFKDIFGERSFIIDGNIFKSVAGIGSKPDWLVISLNKTPEWHIVEAELSSHPIYDHIVNQVGRFINGIKSNITQRKIVETIYDEIKENRVHTAELQELLGPIEIYKFLSDLIPQQPTLTIIIERKTPELDEALELLRYSPIKTIEFRTFRRINADIVHAHLFQPLVVPKPSIEIHNQTDDGLNNVLDDEPKQKRNSSRISVKDLLDSKLVSLNQNIYGEYKGVTYTGKIIENGRIWVDELKKDFDSLSGAAMAVKRVESEDGWRWWYIKDKEGNNTSFIQLRANYESRFK